MTDDVDVLLQDAGADWRADQSGPTEPDWHAVVSRSRRPIWLAAGVFAVIAAVVAGALAWSSGHNSQPAHPTAPVAQPLVPYANGAIVPVPRALTVPHSRPAPIYCKTGNLSGSLTFHQTSGRLVGELRLRLATGSACFLPGILDGDPASLHLLDRKGRVQGSGTDMRSMFPTNVPDFDDIVLTRGRTATMYLGLQGDPFCTAPITSALIHDPHLSVEVPVTGLPSCGKNGTAEYQYGPFSTPAHPVTVENQSWSNLFATIDFPTDLVRSSTATFRVTLANHGNEAIPLTPRAQYGLDIEGSHHGALGSGLIGGPKNPRIIEPGQSITLNLTYSDHGRLPPGKYDVRWAIAGVNTAYAQTTVR